jgi:hypothetical protein
MGARQLGPPISDGGAPIIDYHIAVWTDYYTLTAEEDTNFTDDYLSLPNANSGSYLVYVSARNSVGYSMNCQTWVNMKP